jgi:DNA-binding NtrC family response regulator
MEKIIEFISKDRETVNEFSDLLRRFGIKPEIIIPPQLIRYSLGDFSPIQNNASEKTSPDVSKNSHTYPTLNEIEQRHISHILKLCDGKCKIASKLLGINRTTLYRKMKKYGISRGKKGEHQK